MTVRRKTDYLPAQGGPGVVADNHRHVGGLTGYIRQCQSGGMPVSVIEGQDVRAGLARLDRHDRLLPRPVVAEDGETADISCSSELRRTHHRRTGVASF